MTGCNCIARDPWRCAVQRGLTTVTCHCACHRDRVLRLAGDQYELALGDWHSMVDAPKNATWVEGWNGKKVVKMHFAEDLSGEEQPAFSGWFVDCGSYFGAVHPAPKRWRPITQDEGVP